ncbi:O-antigen ligase family protein [Vaginella massiliensis]|uniref:O-antigen ligase family protein n=1 Tax=Vaginella massiliensis TaxID=1816680 RepID=UPI0008397F68|nr:O-antigen ligase family protein [Vaginella massiliensis]
MKFVLNRDWAYQLLFFVAIAFSYINIYELSFFVWIVVFALTVKRYYSKSFLIYVSFFAILCLIGILRSLFYDYDAYVIFRDLSYFLKPIVGLMIGYQCFRTKDNNFFKTVIYCALIIAIVHLVILANAFVVHHIRYVSQVRHYGGYFSDLETFALIILLFHKKFTLDFSQRKRWIFIGIITTSLCLYFARTNIIQFALVTFGLLGLYRLTRKRIIILSVLILIIGIGYKIIYDMNPARNATGIENFFYKIKNSPREIYDPYVKNDNSSRFHDNFRSYETKVTIKQMLNREDAGIWFGNGFGATVNYGSLMYTNDGTKVRHAPILHNGYTTILLKTGIIGLLVYFSSMFYLIWYGSISRDPLQNNIKLLLNSTGIFLIISTLVFLGYYLKLDNKSLFVGGLIAYYEILKK